MLDFSKTFDPVNHSILLAKLRKMGSEVLLMIGSSHTWQTVSNLCVSMVSTRNCVLCPRRCRRKVYWVRSSFYCTSMIWAGWVGRCNLYILLMTRLSLWRGWISLNCLTLWIGSWIEFTSGFVVTDSRLIFQKLLSWFLFQTGIKMWIQLCSFGM